MAKISAKDISKILELEFNKGGKNKYPRDYLGISQLGHSCARYLWYYFHWAQLIKLTELNLRIFDRGNLEEERIIKRLLSKEFKVTDTQIELSCIGGHLKGHIDGKINLKPLINHTFLGEFKSAKEVYWKRVKKHGIKKGYWEYYVQAQGYMYYTGLKNTLFIITNKNTEEYYFEIVAYNKTIAEEVHQKAHDVLQYNVPPKKLSNDPKFFECNWCEFLDVCHYDAPLLKNCRTCQNSILADNSKWECTKTNVLMSSSMQKAMSACDSKDYNALQI